MNRVTLPFLTEQLELAEQLRTQEAARMEPQDLPGRYGRVVRAVDHLLQATQSEAVLGGGWAVWRHGYVGRVTWDVVRRCVDECVTVEEDEIVDAVVQTMEKSKVLPEAAGVAGAAAILAGHARGAQRIATVISGGNIDLNVVTRILENGLERAGRIHHVEPAARYSCI